jgi:Fe-S cluster assembly iron-binding protein IscA
MITITEQAKKLLRKLLRAKADLPEARLRLIDRGRGKLGLGIDIETPEDHLVKYEDETILVIERGLVANLEGVTLDVENGIEGPELVIDER